MKMTKRILSLLLCAALVFGAGSVCCQAADAVEGTALIAVYDGSTVTADADAPVTAADIPEAGQEEPDAVTSIFMTLLIDFVNVIIQFCTALYDMIQSFM